MRVLGGCFFVIEIPTSPHQSIGLRIEHNRLHQALNHYFAEGFAFCGANFCPHSGHWTRSESIRFNFSGGNCMAAIQADCEERRPDLLQVDFSLAHHERVGRCLFFGSRSNKVFQQRLVISERRYLQITHDGSDVVWKSLPDNRILRLTVQPQFPNKTFIGQSRFKFPACVITGRYGAHFPVLQPQVGYRQ